MLARHRRVFSPFIQGKSTVSKVWDRVLPDVEKLDSVDVDGVVAYCTS